MTLAQARAQGALAADQWRSKTKLQLSYTRISAPVSGRTGALS
jgi:multidrug resistance efflux pump